MKVWFIIIIILAIIVGIIIGIIIHKNKNQICDNWEEVVTKGGIFSHIGLGPEVAKKGCGKYYQVLNNGVLKEISKNDYEQIKYENKNLE